MKNKTVRPRMSESERDAFYKLRKMGGGDASVAMVDFDNRDLDFRALEENNKKLENDLKFLKRSLETVQAKLHHSIVHSDSLNKSKEKLLSAIDQRDEAMTNHFIKMIETRNKLATYKILFYSMFAVLGVSIGVLTG